MKCYFARKYNAGKLNIRKNNLKRNFLEGLHPVYTYFNKTHICMSSILLQCTTFMTP